MFYESYLILRPWWENIGIVRVIFNDTWDVIRIWTLNCMAETIICLIVWHCWWSVQARVVAPKPRRVQEYNKHTHTRQLRQLAFVWLFIAKTIPVRNAVLFKWVSLNKVCACGLIDRNRESKIATGQWLGIWNIHRLCVIFHRVDFPRNLGESERLWISTSGDDSWWVKR